MTVRICPFTSSLREQSKTPFEKSHSPLLYSLTCGSSVFNKLSLTAETFLDAQRTIHTLLWTEDWPPHIHHACGRPAEGANDMKYTAGWSCETSLSLSLSSCGTVSCAQSKHYHHSLINSLLCALKSASVRLMGQKQIRLPWQKLTDLSYYQHG